MAKEKAGALKRASRNALGAAFVLAALSAAAGAFAIGFSGSVQQSFLDPGSYTVMRVAALQHLDAALGYDGFLKSYRAYLSTADKTSEAQVTRFAQDAAAALKALAATSNDDAARASAAQLQSEAEPFRRASLYGTDAVQGGALLAPPPLTTLEQAYGALKDDIAKATEAAYFRHVEDLSSALIWSEACVAAALSLLATVLFALAWYLRQSLLDPLENVRRAVSSAAAGALAEPIWGMERRDEAGSIARAADRLRQAAAAATAQNGAASTEGVGRLAKSVAELEDDISRIVLSANRARLRVDEASTKVLKASQAAVEAAGLAREGARAIAGRAEGTIDAAGEKAQSVIAALGEAVGRLAQAAARLEGAPGAIPLAEASSETMTVMREAQDIDAGLRGAVLGDARIAAKHADDTTAALFEAVARLNDVAERLAQPRADAPKITFSTRRAGA